MLILTGCVPLTPTSTSYNGKKLALNNFNYESLVGMVQLYPNTQGDQASLDYPVFQVGGPDLKITFDLLEENYRYVQARYIHCSANWERSPLADIQFLDTYNEFTFNDYEYSSNTRIPYVNYSGTLPLPAIPGNYLVAVYNEGNEQDLLFVRRICVYDQRAKIDVGIYRSDIVASRTTNQQIEFSVNYNVIQNANPIQDFKVIILQNHNWNNANTNLQPTLVRSDQNYMEYHHFNGENNFKGHNEFRFFDIRTIDYRGINVSRIEKREEGVHAYLNTDKPRAELAYTQINEDLNGNFFLQNTDPGDSPTQSEYVEVHFELAAEPIDGDVFINGHLTNWNLSSDNLMVYNEAKKTYNGSVLLKQGYYDYMYSVKSESLPSDHFEGSNFQTQNNYEILLYYRSPARNYDELIGYKSILSRN